MQSHFAHLKNACNLTGAVRSEATHETHVPDRFLLNFRSSTWLYTNTSNFRAAENTNKTRMCTDVNRYPSLFSFYDAP